MKLKDLIIKKEYGFSDSFSDDMTSGMNKRLQLFDMDMFDWANSECVKRCNVNMPKKFEDGAICEECDCAIAKVYWGIVKLGILESALNDVEITGENIEAEVVDDEKCS